MACAFAGDYHDTIWGVPVRDSRILFAQLSLCTQQCGVSWRIVWNKRHHYEAAFHGWDRRKVAQMTAEDVDALCDKSGPWAGKIIQNRPKLAAIVNNAQKCVEIDDSHPGGLSAYLWSFVDGRDDEATNTHAHGTAAYDENFGVTSQFSDALARALKGERGFKFLGSVTLQAFLLQNGQLNGHAPGCPCHARCKREGGLRHGRRRRAAGDRVAQAPPRRGRHVGGRRRRRHFPLNASIGVRRDCTSCARVYVCACTATNSLAGNIARRVHAAWRVCSPWYIRQPRANLGLSRRVKTTYERRSRPTAHAAGERPRADPAARGVDRLSHLCRDQPVRGQRCRAIAHRLSRSPSSGGRAPPRALGPGGIEAIVGGIRHAGSASRHRTASRVYPH